MHDTLNLEHIQALPRNPEAERTRFDPEFQNSTRLYLPEQRLSSEPFTRNTHLEIVANTEQAAELATPAGDTFRVPQTLEQIAAEQEAYAAVITEKTNVVSIEQRRYAGAAEMHREITNGGEAIEMVRNAA